MTETNDARPLQGHESAVEQCSSRSFEEDAMTFAGDCSSGSRDDYECDAGLPSR